MYQTKNHGKRRKKQTSEPVPSPRQRRRVADRDVLRNKRLGVLVKQTTKYSTMNNTLLVAQYLITGLIGYLALVQMGPAMGLVSFVVANILWTWAQEALLNQNNRSETRKWKQRNQG